MVKIETKIKQFKKNLINKARAKGLYENFGQIEVRKLKDQYKIGFMREERKNMDLIQEFNEWCMCQNDNSIKEGLVE